MLNDHQVSIQISHASKSVVIRDLNNKHKRIAVQGAEMNALLDKIEAVANENPSLTLNQGLAIATSDITAKLWS